MDERTVILNILERFSMNSITEIELANGNTEIEAMINNGKGVSFEFDAAGNVVDMICFD